LQSLVVGSWSLAFLANTFSVAKFQRQTFKERENGVSQLNRLGKRCRATSLTTSAFSARSRRSFSSCSTQVLVGKNLSSASVQVLTENEQPTTNDCCSE